MTLGRCRAVAGDEAWSWARRGFAGVVAAACFFASDASSIAQTQTQPNVILGPLREAPRETEQIQGTSGTAENQRLLQPDRPVTFDDVLAHPDDVDLNYAYAQIQIQRGDLHGAAATLERIILIAPDLPRVRLLYAVVLYRLDNLDEAERELRAVDSYDMPASLRAELGHYLDDIRLRRRTTRYALTVSANLQQDWNKNAAAASGFNLVSDFPAQLVGHNQRRGDQSLLMLTRLDVGHDLGYQARHQVTGSISYYRDQQNSLSEYDLTSISGEVGGVYDAAPFTIIPNFYRRRITLDNRFYSYLTGTEWRVVDQFDRDLQFYGLGGAEYQQFDPIAIEQNAPEYNGWQYMAGGGVAYALNASMRINVEMDGIRKLAVRDYNSYDGMRLTVAHTWVFANGMFVITAVSGEEDFYKEPYTVVSVQTRHDRIGRGRVTYGVPVSVFFEDYELPDYLRDLTFTASFEAVRQLSNVTNYTYNNRDGSVGFIKRWEF